MTVFRVSLKIKGDAESLTAKWFTFVECSKCNVRLYLTKASNCFWEFYESWVNDFANPYLSYLYSTVSFIYWKYFVFRFCDVHFSEMDNSYDGSLFIYLFMLCYFLLLAVDSFPMNTVLYCVSVLVSFEIYITWNRKFYLGFTGSRKSCMVFVGLKEAHLNMDF